MGGVVYFDEMDGTGAIIVRATEKKSSLKGPATGSGSENRTESPVLGPPKITILDQSFHHHFRHLWPAQSQFSPNNITSQKGSAQPPIGRCHLATRVHVVHIMLKPLP
jgi:hypothetical protein